jgi:putative transposase
MCGALRQIEAENVRLKKLIVERDLEIGVMKEVAAKNVWYAPVLQYPSFCCREATCVNVSGLSRVNCCCSPAIMRCARIVPKKWYEQDWLADSDEGG